MINVQHQVRVQDPTSEATSYLLESIAEAAADANDAVGVFAFASRRGVDMLLSEPTLIRLLGHGRLTLVVGIDAVTDHATLKHLQECSSKSSNLQVRVFWNSTSALFHPKVCYFRGPKRHTAVVGSGNLTPGGLRDHFEMYTVTTGTPTAMGPMVEELLAFQERHRSSIRAIDKEAFDRAACNKRERGVRSAIDIEPDQNFTHRGVIRNPSQDRVLIAELPKGGDRWQQANFDGPTITSFFRADAASPTKRLVFLNEVNADGSLGPNEIRPCVLTKSRNLRIQLRAHNGEYYPTCGRPIAVFRELKARHFAYLLLVPGDFGYSLVSRLLSVDAPGRIRREHISLDALMTGWKTCPLGRLRVED